MAKSRYIDVCGILTIFAREPNWPNPANIYIIPDENGFSLVDVGCGGASGIEYLQNGLHHWNLNIERLHTVVLSHAHPDHMGAIWWILEETDPNVFIHRLDVAPALDPLKLEETFDIPLAKLEALNAATLLPAHGTVMNNAKKAIQSIRKKLLQRESFLIEALQGGAKQIMELNQALIENALLHFFPVCGIIESHLIKLEQEGIIMRDGSHVSLIT